MSENPYFESFDKVTSKKAAVDFLMILALREELNLYNSQDPMGMYFTQEVINKMSLKYFNVSEFNARDTSAYNSETGLYSYTNTAVPVDLEKITDFEEDTANNRYYVTISRFEDPLYLYKIREVTYTLDKSSDGIYRILSAKEPASDNNAKNTDNSADLTTNGYSTDSEATND